MPAQMTYTGRNLDIVTGASAIVVAGLLLAGTAGRRLRRTEHLGLALLLNVIIVAIVSTPIFRMFGDDQLNVFVTYPPFVAARRDPRGAGGTPARLPALGTRRNRGSDGNDKRR